MAIQQKPQTVEEFEAFVMLPENEGRLFEFLRGELIEVSPGRAYNSEIRDLLVVAVHLFCRQHNVPCHTTGEAGTYRIRGERVAPDFAYKRTLASRDYPDPVAPEWVAEVISPNDTASYIHNKRRLYAEAGILLWEIYPDSYTVDVYAPVQAPRSVGVDGVLDGSEVLPGFTMPVKDLFPEE